MKKALSVLLALLLVLMLLPVGAIPVLVRAEDDVNEAVVNVKDFGAVGDGKTDDRQAIMDAFYHAMVEYMNHDIPVTVYFPEGQYGLLDGGMYIYMPRGFGNLTIKGDGADKSTIVYLDEWDNNGSSWVALRIYPKITPTSIDEYLHDITIQDLGVYDTDPVKHAWSTENGDPSTEETHGFNIQHCVRATIKNCKVSNVGDEAIDMSHCIDSVMRDNFVENSPGAGSAGGAISVGDGSKNVLITNNTVIGSINDSSKTNWAIAVEALVEQVENIEISNNTIQDIAGYGINLGAPNGTMADIVVRNNTIYHCRDGGIRLGGQGRTTNIQLVENSVSKTQDGIAIEGANKEGTLIDRCVVEGVSNYGINVKSPTHKDTIIQNTTIRNAKWRAIYNAGINTKIDRVLIDTVGTYGNVTDSAVVQYTGGGDSEITNSIILNCQNKRAIQGVNKVVNTYIDQVEEPGYSSISGAMLIQHCRVNRLVNPKTGSVIDGLVLYTESDLGTHAINLASASSCTITNCVFTMPSRYAVNETVSSDNNVITNNICVGGSGVKTVSANTVAEGNVRAQKAATEMFTYRIVDGAVTVMAPVDPALTELVIPAAIEDCPVTAIDPWAFALCDGLTCVTLPDSLTAVGDSAFAYCTALTDVYYGGLEWQRDSVAFGMDNTALTDAAWRYHWENHNYDHGCDPDCNDCEFIREVGDHVYDGVCDGACNECGFTREVPDHEYQATVVAPDCVDDGYTVHTCVGCGDSYITDEVPSTGHICDNACDPDCNICGAIRPVPDHVYDDDRDADCNECGAVREVTVVLLGDVNGDGRINNQDLGIVQRYLADYEVTIDLVAADVKKDGKVNNRDMGLLQQYLTDWDVTFG